MPSHKDDIGAETLRRMSALVRYGLWVIERIRPWVGKRVLEVGSGIGNNSRHFLDSEALFLTDVSDEYLAILRERFGGHDTVTVDRFNLEESGAHLRGKGIDTVVALNVLEHIRDDAHALGELSSILAPGGHIILQLPAHPLLYGTLDRNLGHYRRYTVGDIRARFSESGITPVRFFHMNMPGALGWFVYSRVLKHTLLPKGPLSIFNRLTPLIMAVEQAMNAPFGLSIIAVGRKEPADGP